MNYMKRILIFLFLTQGFLAYPQKYFTKTGTINFKAGTALEDIDALNKSATAIFDVATGAIEVAVLQKGFEFRRALMQEHYNENYVESDKFPKAVFKGTLVDLSKVDFKKDGAYPTIAKGILELHGKKKEVEVPVSLTVTGGVVSSNATFSVQVSDFDIKIPGAVKDKISPTVDIKIDCTYKAM